MLLAITMATTIIGAGMAITAAITTTIAASIGTIGMANMMDTTMAEGNIIMVVVAAIMAGGTINHETILLPTHSSFLQRSPCR